VKFGLFIVVCILAMNVSAAVAAVAVEEKVDPVEVKQQQQAPGEGLVH